MVWERHPLYFGHEFGTDKSDCELDKKNDSVQFYQSMKKTYQRAIKRCVEMFICQMFPQNICSKIVCLRKYILGRGFSNSFELFIEKCRDSSKGHVNVFIKLESLTTDEIL